MIYAIGILVSMIIIWRVCESFEEASNYLGRNLSEGVKGATINAIGSSMPELLSAFIALVFYADKEGLAFGIGITAGSAIFNSAVIPSLVILSVIYFGIAKKVTVMPKVILRDGIFLLIAEIVLIYLLAGNSLTWKSGLMLMCIYSVYAAYMLISMPSRTSFVGKTKLKRIKKDKNRLLALVLLDVRRFLFLSFPMNAYRAWVVLIASVAAIGVACHMLVESCYGLGENLGIANYFVAVLLAAAATSVPDTVISIKDAKKGNYDDAVSNALGSNIFDISACLGLPIFVYCLITGETIVLATSQDSVTELRVLLLFLTVVILAIFIIGKTLGKLKGYLMLGTYLSFVTYIVCRFNEIPWAVSVGNYLIDLTAIFGLN